MNMAKIKTLPYSCAMYFKRIIMKNKSVILKKLCATLTTACFIFTIVTNNLYASINIDAIQAFYL